jgi:hypothetical protein
LRLKYAILKDFYFLDGFNNRQDVFTLPALPPAHSAQEYRGRLSPSEHWNPAIIQKN